MLPPNLTAQQLEELNERSIGLAGQGRTDEALTICQEIVNQYGASSDPKTRVQVVRAHRNVGSALSLLGKTEQAFQAFDKVIERYGTDPDPEVRTYVAQARLQRSFTLRNLGQVGQAIEAFEEIERIYALDESAATQQEVAKARSARASTITPDALAEALVKRYDLFKSLGLHAEVVQVCDEIIEKLSSETVPLIQRQLATAMLSKGRSLGALERHEEAVEVWKELAQQFGNSADPDIRESVALGLFNCGLYFESVEQVETAVAAYNAVRSRFGNDHDEKVLFVVAMSLVNQANNLKTIGKQDEADAANDEVVRLFGSSDSPPFQHQVAMALVNKGINLNERGRQEEALRVYEEVVQRFGTTSMPEIEDRLREVMWSIGVTFQALERPEAALAAYDRFLARFLSSEDAFSQLRCVQTLVNKAETLRKLQQYDKALKCLNEVGHHSERHEDVEFREQEVRALWCVATCARENGDDELALEVYDAMLERFGKPANNPIRSFVAQVVMEEAATLMRAEMNREAWALFSRIVSTFEGASEPELCRVVGIALHEQGTLLAGTGQFQEAIPYFDAASQLFARRGEDWARSKAAQTEHNKAFCLEQLRQIGVAYQPPVPKKEISPVMEAPDAAPKSHYVRTVTELLSAVDKASSNDMVLLHAGRYELDEPLILEKSLCLGGEGADKTHFVCKEGTCAVVFAGPGVWLVQNLGFELEEAGDVLNVAGGTLKIRGCTFRGARRNVGINMRGAKSVLVRECHITNTSVGIHVGEGVEAVIENNQIENNGIAGIIFTGDAKGVARGNTCGDHFYAGIVIGGEATPLIEGNLCYRANFGLVYKDQANGQALENRCTANFVGIGVTDSAAPELQSNLCKDNFAFGVTDSAAPELQSNLCKDNFAYGLVYNEDAAGSASDNDCSSNRGMSARDNLRVLANARPELGDNATEGEADEESNNLFTEEFGTRMTVQLMRHMDLQGTTNLDALVPGLRTTPALHPELKQSIFDLELLLAAVFADVNGNDAELFFKNVMPKWIKIYKRIVAEGRVYQ